MPHSSRISAISLDFFNTLVQHRHACGRGALLMRYFRAQGWSSDPWKHSVLYDLFAAHGSAYVPEAVGPRHSAFCVGVAQTLFELLRVRADPALAEEHALALWGILGPDHLTLFPEVDAVLPRLRATGCRLVVVSNWQAGLTAFCQALGLAAYCEAVVASAEVGFEKPDPRIFSHACARLGLPPEHVLHVGDSATEDVGGARSAGLHALLLRRGDGQDDAPGTVRSLAEVATFVEERE